MTSRTRPTACARVYRASRSRRSDDLTTRIIMLFVQFTLDQARYVLDSSQIERMLPLAPLTTMPGVPAWVAGIFKYEGAPVPVIDLAALALGRRSHERLSTR